MSDSLVFRVICDELPADYQIGQGDALLKKPGERSDVLHAANMLDPHQDGFRPPNNHDSDNPPLLKEFESSSKYQSLMQLG